MTEQAMGFLVQDYNRKVTDTDVIGPRDLKPVLQGLFGEVGGIMATAKKHIREKSAYPGYRRAAEEEFGDTFWYLAAICRRLGVSLEEVMVAAAQARRSSGNTQPNLDDDLFCLGRAAADLLKSEIMKSELQEFATCYLTALDSTQLSFDDVLRSNIKKTRGAFITPSDEELIDFDADFELEEKLPPEFRIRINERKSGRSYLQWNGVFIGDPLTDNIPDPDGYRFHDVFHLANAAILHWSPVVRALIKHKRKSLKEYDEGQDGGRAIVVEEGLTAWIFSQAKELQFFANHDRISLDILKTIGQFVSGYEVDRCPLKLWEKSILEGYKVFREVRAAKGGWVVGDRRARSISFEPLEGGR